MKSHYVIVGAAMVLSVGCSKTRPKADRMNTNAYGGGPSSGELARHDGGMTDPSMMDPTSRTAVGGGPAENATDMATTQKIRQALVADRSLSFDAQNVKITTDEGRVTLRGPVATQQERDAVESAAIRIVGPGQVDNQVEVDNTK
jgi:hypothetical protein